MHTKSDEAVLCFYMHPWEFIPMPKSMASISFKEFLWKNTGDYACRELDKLIEGLVDRGSEIMSMKEYVDFG